MKCIRNEDGLVLRYSDAEAKQMVEQTGIWDRFPNHVWQYCKKSEWKRQKGKPNA